MSSIKFNYFTKEIEMRGTESFIQSNFNKIQDLLVENEREKKRMLSAEAGAQSRQEPLSLVKITKSQQDARMARRECSEASPVSSAAGLSVPEIPGELKMSRPPLRKYIRKQGIPGHQRTVVEIAEEKPKELSLAALKEKFGLSTSKIEGAMRDAEKLGKIKRVVNGAYVFTQD